MAATFAAGRYPPAPHTFLRFVPACLAAGPGPIVRRLRLSSIQDRGHPDDDRVFLWFLAVDPAHQRGGVGRAAMGSAGRSSRA